MSLAPSVTVKIRNPVHVLLFDLMTLGIYGTVWYFRVNRELAQFGRSRHTADLGENPKKSLLALVPGLLIIVPAVISMRNTVRRLAVAQRLAGVPAAEHVSVPTGFALLLLLPPVGSWYFQKRLNDVWHTELGRGGQPVEPQPTPEPVREIPPAA